MSDLNIDQKQLRLSIYLSQGFILLLGIGLIWFIFLRTGRWNWVEFSSQRLLIGIILSLILTSLSILLQIGLYYYVPHHLISDEINKLFYRFSYIELLFIFILGSFAEEILFRGVIQNIISIFVKNDFFAIVGSSLAFAVLHVRYLSKPLLLVVVIIFGFTLGGLYTYTETLLFPILTHFLINYIMVCLGKKGYFVPKE